MVLFPKKTMVSTGGLGSGAGLGSEGSVTLSANGRWLFVVNAGSNQISAFSVRENGLTLTDVVDLGGLMPISLTVRGSLVYVLNAGGSGNITGFRLRAHGKLAPLAGTTQPSAMEGPAHLRRLHKFRPIHAVINLW